MEQLSPEWFEARRGRVTGSIVGGILGLSPFMTRSDAMRMMVRDREGAEREFTGNPATAWGSVNEAVALGEYEIETGHDVHPAPFVPFEDWLGASPDGYVGEEGLVEFKCPFGIRNDPDPIFKILAEQPHYYAQCQIELFVTDRQWLHFVQWTPNGFRYETVRPDQNWLDENLPELRQFYAEFLDEPADDHLMPKRVEIDTPEAARMIREWDEINEALDNLADRKKDLLDSMVKLAGERNALIAGRKLTLTERAGAVAYAKVVKEHCKGVNLEPYRGKPSRFWGVR